MYEVMLEKCQRCHVFCADIAYMSGGGDLCGKCLLDHVDELIAKQEDFLLDCKEDAKQMEEEESK